MTNVYVYYIGATILLLFSLIFKKSKFVYFYCSLILFFIWGGNRFNGADWINYISVYKKLGDVSIYDAVFSGDFEWIFSIWMWLFSISRLPYEVFVASVATFNVFFIIWVLKKIKVENPGLFLVVLLWIDGWTLYHEQLRQSLAVSVCLVAIFYYINGNKYRSYFLVFLALGFHISSVFVVFIFYICGLVSENNNKPVALSKLFFISLIPVFSGVFIFLVLNSPVLGFLNLTRIQDKMDYYSNDNLSGSSLINIGMLAYVLGFFILLAYRNMAIEKRSAWCSSAWSVAILWCLMGPWLRTYAILSRFEHYLIIFFPFLVCRYSNYFESKRFSENLLRLIIFLFSVTFFVRITLNPGHAIWVSDYQNNFAGELFGSSLTDFEDRQNEICVNFKLIENNFCGDGY